MEILRDLYQTRLTRPTYLSIGNFDGVHRGHQALLRDMVAAAHADSALAGVLTFDPHPRAVLRPDTPLYQLSAPVERLDLLAGLHLDFVLIQPFSLETAQISAEEFTRQLAGHLHLRELWVGPDFALGRQRQGTVPVLRELGVRFGFAVRVFDVQRQDGDEVRSGRIRELLREGDVATAARLLGRPYTLAGEVVHGERRGGRIGFPTANLAVPAGRLVPANGVYATWAELAGVRRASVTNIGVRPTFGGQDRSVEAHLIDYRGSLYGDYLILHFIERLRPEQRFANVDELRAQIARDTEQARVLLAAAVTHAGATTVGKPVYEELEHTADWAVRVFGESLPALYANAGQTLFRLMGAPFERPVTVERAVAVEGIDREALLVNWLQELLYLMETTGELYTLFDVPTIELSTEGTVARLQTTVRGVVGRSDLAHVKAITYHDLSVRQTAQGWEATLVFDT